MAEGFKPDDPFHDLEGRDGYHVVCLPYGPAGIALSCVVIGGGELFNAVSDRPEDATVELRTLDAPTPAEYGAFTRLMLVMDGVARYLTTGGDWGELETALRAVRPIMTGGLVFPGYTLTNTFLGEDNTYHHLFTHADGVNAALWAEPEIGDGGLPVGGWILATTVEKLVEGSEHGIIWGRADGEEKAEAEARTPGATCLPAIRD